MDDVTLLDAVERAETDRAMQTLADQEYNALGQRLQAELERQYPLMGWEVADALINHNRCRGMPGLVLQIFDVRGWVVVGGPNEEAVSVPVMVRLNRSMLEIPKGVELAVEGVQWRIGEAVARTIAAWRPEGDQ